MRYKCMFCGKRKHGTSTAKNYSNQIIKAQGQCSVGYITLPKCSIGTRIEIKIIEMGSFKEDKK